MLSADQGTIPMSLRIDNRTQAGELFVVDPAALRALDSSDCTDLEAENDDPSKAARVSSIGRGKARVRIGANGVASSVAKTDPSDVVIVISKVASKGWKRAPASTF